MTHEVIRHLLDDYVTGDLPDTTRAPVAEHIAGCEMCSAEVESLMRVIARAADLPRSMDPPVEAWTNIRAAIVRDETTLAQRVSVARTRFWRRSYSVAAAALVAAFLSSSATYLYLTQRLDKRAMVASSSRSDATPASLAAFTIEENNYLRTASTLQVLLDQQKDALAPETVVQLKVSLRTIDEAILEARNALARDPANKTLVEMLSASYRQKVDLLRRTTEMTRGS